MLLSDSKIRVRAVLLVLAAAFGLLLPVPDALTAARAQEAAETSATALPARLSDADFWKLASDISEPGGFFRITDNYTSNEMQIGQIVGLLKERKISGGVYLGVGPEQNFTYIAAVRPAMAFIVDIRRQAVMQHLMFKAIFEMSKDRADFISLLFAKPRPKDLAADGSIQSIWEAFFKVATDQDFAAKTREQIVDRLTKTHKFTLTDDEKWQLESVIGAFVMYGPGITTRGTMQGGRGGNSATFADLTGWSYDPAGTPQSFLSTNENFQVVKALHDKNLIVPASGDFGGPKTLRAIGAYLAARKAAVSAYYVSNVEQYLFQDLKAELFYQNVATLPVTDTSVFIRPYAVQRGGNALCPIGAFLQAVKAGRIYSDTEARSCSVF
jgi:hypothetical protein